MLLSQAQAIVDTLLEHRTHAKGVWFLDGYRERAIERLWNSADPYSAISDVDQILKDGAIVWDKDDPCDEVRV